MNIQCTLFIIKNCETNFLIQCSKPFSGQRCAIVDRSGHFTGNSRNSLNRWTKNQLERVL